MRLDVSLPECYGSPVTPAEVVYLRDVMLAEFEPERPTCINPTLRGSRLFTRFRLDANRKLSQVWLQDTSQSRVAILTRT